MAAKLPLVLLAALAVSTVGAGGAADGGGSCGGLAPVQFVCTTGEVRMPFRLQLELDPNFTGGIASVLMHDDGERVLRCEYLMGEMKTCAGSGTFPPPGAEATHQCRTFFYGSPLPGGVGRWQCTIEQV